METIVSNAAINGRNLKETKQKQNAVMFHVTGEFYFFL